MPCDFSNAASVPSWIDGYFEKLNGMLTRATCASPVAFRVDVGSTLTLGSPGCHRPEWFKLPIGLRREEKIALRQAIDFVRPDFDLAFAPRQVKIGMVPLGLGDGTDLVDKCQRLREILERVQPFEVALRVQGPSAAEFLQ
jgi:hypothetical protein